MKNLTILLTAMLVTALSCTKVKPTPPEANGEMSFMINGESAQGYPYYYDWDEGLQIVWKTYLEYNGELYKDNTLGIRYIDKTLSRQVLYQQSSGVRTKANFSTTQDLDVTCDFYYVYEPDSANNWIEITAENNDFREIWGEFSVTLYRVQDCSSSTYPDTLRIRHGSFHFSL